MWSVISVLVLISTPRVGGLAPHQEDGLQLDGLDLSASSSSEGPGPLRITEAAHPTQDGMMSPRGSEAQPRRRLNFYTKDQAIAAGESSTIPAEAAGPDEMSISPMSQEQRNVTLGRKSGAERHRRLDMYTREESIARGDSCGSFTFSGTGTSANTGVLGTYVYQADDSNGYPCK